MRLYVGNVITRAEFGGKDFLNKLPNKLRDYLKVPLKNVHFMRKQGYKMDGFRYFVNHKGEFATGFLPLVYEYFKELTDIEVIDERTNVPKFKEGALDLELPMYKGYAAHQERMVVSVNREVAGLYFPRGIWQCATNARKTATLAMLLNNLEEPKTLLLVHNETLYKQHKEFYQALYGEVGEINSKKYTIKPFTIAMVRSTYNKMRASNTVKRDLATYFNVVSVDECHRAGGSEYSTLLQKVGAGVRIFMSGTPLDGDDDVSNAVIVGLSSNIICTVTKKELMDADISLRPFVTMLQSRQMYRTYFTYEEEYENLIKLSKDRAEQMADEILKRPFKKILINFVEKDHGYFMLEVLKSREDLSHLYIDIVHGEEPNREAKIQQYINGEIDVLLTSVIMQEGINVKDINVLMYAQGGKSSIALSQWSGRTERHDGVSTEVEIVDWWDEGKYLEKHSKERIKFYEKEQFEIRYEYEQRNGKPLKSNR